MPPHPPPSPRTAPSGSTRPLAPPRRSQSSRLHGGRGHLAVAAAAAVACLGTATTARAVSSAEFYTPDGHGYGRFEARLMFPAGDGVVGSFFLWKDGSEMTGTYWNELDYEKIDANCSLQINSFYGLPAAQHQNLVSSVSHLCDAYHTYAFEWTPDHIAWSIDGTEVRRDTGAAAQAYADNALSQGLQFRFSIWPGDSTFGGNFSASILPIHEFISWVQYSAYTPGTGDVACNFTLAWRESFDQGIPSTWAEGNWMSAKNLSTHTPANVTASNGVAVLSLTADDMTGFTGTPPADDGDLPSVPVSDAGPDGTLAPPDAAPVQCDAGSSTETDGGSAGSSGSSGGGTSGGGTSSAHAQGGGCASAPSEVAGGTIPAVAAMIGIASALRRRRGAKRGRKTP